MTNSYTNSETTTFTTTHAKHIAAKFAADLKRMQRFYNSPTDFQITNYEIEVIELLKHGYFGILTVGFKRNSKWIEPTLKYTASNLLGITDDDDPGKLRPGANIEGASFCNFLIYSPAWKELNDADRKAFEKRIPFCRTYASEPSISGYLVNDRVYSSGNRSLNRASVRSYQ